MAELTRREIFARASEKLRADFAELNSVPHSALKGSEAERLIRAFLRNHLPKRFDVGSGFIIDRRDNLSKQTDVIIYDALNCPIYRFSDDAGIFPADNVAAVVEVKSVLDSQKLEQAWENIEAAKQLAKSRHPDGSADLLQTMGIVFGFSSSVSMDTLSQTYRRLFVDRGLGRHVDLVAILDTGTLMLHAKPRGHNWAAVFVEGLGGPHAEGSHFCVGATEFGRDTLDAFLRLLLGKLAMFPGRLGHPGFDWQNTDSKGVTKMTYLMSLTQENDQKIRTQKLEAYAAEVRAEFGSKS